MAPISRFILVLFALILTLGKKKKILLQICKCGFNLRFWNRSRLECVLSLISPSALGRSKQLLCVNRCFLGCFWFVPHFASCGFPTVPPPGSSITIFACNAAAPTPAALAEVHRNVKSSLKWSRYLSCMCLIYIMPFFMESWSFLLRFASPNTPLRSGPTHCDGNPRQDHAIQEQDGGRSRPKAAAGVPGGVRGAAWAHEETGLAFNAAT